MPFTGQFGKLGSFAENVVPGSGPFNHHFAQSLTASVTPTSHLTGAHIFIFNMTSVTAFRAMGRILKLITKTRTSV